MLRAGVGQHTFPREERPGQGPEGQRREEAGQGLHRGVARQKDLQMHGAGSPDAKGGERELEVHGDLPDHIGLLSWGGLGPVVTGRGAGGAPSVWETEPTRPFGKGDADKPGAGGPHAEDGRTSRRGRGGLGAGEVHTGHGLGTQLRDLGRGTRGGGGWCWRSWWTVSPGGHTSPAGQAGPGGLVRKETGAPGAPAETRAGVQPECGDGPGSPAPRRFQAGPELPSPVSASPPPPAFPGRRPGFPEGPERAGGRGVTCARPGGRLVQRPGRGARHPGRRRAGRSGEPEGGPGTERRPGEPRRP